MGAPPFWSRADAHGKDHYLQRTWAPRPGRGQAVDLANRYASEITIGREDKSVNGKSIMGVLMLAAAQGSSISVSTEGPDADQALADLLALIDSGFGEN